MYISKQLKIHIEESPNLNSGIQEYCIEADWSSAAFWYQIAALNKNAQVILNNLSLDTLQGDKIIAKLLSNWVETKTVSNDIVIQSNSLKHNQELIISLNTFNLM
jgi:5-enolpyruvylshikimate-3-phosphate synthase